MNRFVDTTSVVKRFLDTNASPPTPSRYRMDGLALKALRNQAGIPIQRAAKEAGVFATTVYDWEMGFDRPTAEQERALVTFYNRVYETIKATGGVRDGGSSR